MSSKAVLACVVLVLSVVAWFQRRKQRNLPPGPPPIPLIGNLFDMPLGNEWLVFTEWSKVYASDGSGDVISIRVLGQTVVVLNGEADVKELLVTRGTHYGGRPRFLMGDLAGWADAVGLSSPGETFRTARRFMAKVLGPNVVSHNLIPVVDEVITASVRRLVLECPDDPLRELRRASASVLLKLEYGYDVEDGEDEFVNLSEQALNSFFASTAPGWVVDTFPFLRFLPSWMPGAGFKRQAAAMRKLAMDARQRPLQWTKEQIDAGTAPYSIAAEVLSESENRPILEASLTDLFIAGFDTVFSAVSTLVLVLALHPEVQALGQAEVDSVTLGERLPGYEDRACLPFVNAIVKEVYRWRGVGNIGLPHRAMSSGEYKGYFIPDDAIIFANIWAIFHNPEKYPDPMMFNPNRFMGQTPNDFENMVNEDPTRYVFGFGIRQCPGRHLADATIFLLAAKLLATCTFSDAVDEDGTPLTPASVKYLPGIVSHPAPYRCRIVPRSNRTEADGFTF